MHKIEGLLLALLHVAALSFLHGQWLMLIALIKQPPLAQTVDDYEALLPWNIELGPL